MINAKPKTIQRYRLSCLNYLEAPLIMQIMFSRKRKNERMNFIFLLDPVISLSSGLPPPRPQFSVINEKAAFTLEENVVKLAEGIIFDFHKIFCFESAQIWVIESIKFRRDSFRILLLNYNYFDLLHLSLPFKLTFEWVELLCICRFEIKSIETELMSIKVKF